MQFLIVDNMSHNAIIGTDELDENGMIIDYLNGYLQIGEKVITIYKDYREANDNYEGNNKIVNISIEMNMLKERVDEIKCNEKWRNQVKMLLGEKTVRIELQINISIK